MREKGLLSVIVPVYKVEPYLRRCIDSIRTQTYQNLQIILVDDGSPDNCGSICDEYTELDSRIIAVHQKNEGLSGARNNGMLFAKGEYVSFPYLLGSAPIDNTIEYRITYQVFF